MYQQRLREIKGLDLLLVPATHEDGDTEPAGMVKVDLREWLRRCYAFRTPLGFPFF